MKKLFIYVVTFLTFTLPSFYSHAEKTCFSEGVITNLYIGYIDGGQAGGPDSGNAIMIDYNRGGSLGTIPVNHRYNLNSDKGPAFFSMLKSALLTGQKVTVKDHYGSNCDDFDEIIFHN
ncbi:hypothetical protein [Aeromonas salmonicida]|uniref:hypothetical protein n=1 Tax=Aeromonas salmonicida TaxID=645 RepID=UPI0031FD589D